MVSSQALSDSRSDVLGSHFVEIGVKSAMEDHPLLVGGLGQGSQGVERLCSASMLHTIRQRNRLRQVAAPQLVTQGRIRPQQMHE